MAKVLHFASGATNSTSGGATQYWAFGDSINLSTGNTTESNYRIRCKSAGVLSNLYCGVSSNTSAAASTFRVRINGANGNQSLSVASSTTGGFEDSSNTDSVSVGDLFCPQIVRDAGAGIFVLNRQSIAFAATTDTVKTLVSATSSNLSATASTTYYVPLAGIKTSASTTEGASSYKTRIAGTLRNLFIKVDTNGRTTATVWKSRINNADGNLSVSVTGSTTGDFEDTSNSDTITAADLINLKYTTGTGTGNTWAPVTQVEFVSTASKFFFLSASSNSYTNQNASATRYYFMGGSNTNDTSETTSKQKSRVAFTASNLGIYLNTNTVSAASTLTFRANAAATALTVSLTASTSGLFEDTSNSVTVASTDEICYEIVTGASGTSMTVSWIGMAATIEASTAVKDIISMGLIPFAR